MNEWQPIESAPKDGTEILLLRRDVGRQLMCVGKWDANFHGSGWYRDKGWMMTGYQGLAHDAVSPPPELWMPLPPPPSTPKQGEGEYAAEMVDSVAAAIRKG